MTQDKSDPPTPSELVTIPASFVEAMLHQSTRLASQFNEYMRCQNEVIESLRERIERLENGRADTRPGTD